MLRQHLKNKFRAIQLSVPTAIAHFRVVHRNADGNLIDTRDYNIDLNSGRQSFSKVWLKVVAKNLVYLAFTFCIDKLKCNVNINDHTNEVVFLAIKRHFTIAFLIIASFSQ